jgi:hypothetical protein
LNIADGLRLVKHPKHPFGEYCANLRLAERFRHLPGAVVECGTWKGGMIAGLACVFGARRAYYLFDSFEGPPAAKEIDGAAALRWQADTQSPRYHVHALQPRESLPPRAAPRADPHLQRPRCQHRQAALMRNG